MPGAKYRSLKAPHIYEALRRKGYSKQRAARISNTTAAKLRGTHRKRRRRRRVNGQQA